MLHLIYAPTIKIRLRNAKRLEVIIHLRLLQTNPSHHPTSHGLHPEMENPRPAISEGGGVTRDVAVVSRQRGAMRDSRRRDLAVDNPGRSMVVRVKADSRIGKRRDPRPARRVMNPKCGCAGLDLKLANLASRPDRK